MNRPVLQIPNADLSPEKSPYRITLQINRLGAPVVAAAPIVVQVIDGSAIDRDCDVPSLKISSDRAALSFDEENDVQVLVINRQERSNLLRASVFSNDGTPIGDLRNAPFDLEWSFDGSVVASGRLFAIDNELLSSVSTPYTFTLTARQPCTEGADPFARITLRQNLPPSGGSITVSPAVGDSLSTKVRKAIADLIRRSSILYSLCLTPPAGQIRKGIFHCSLPSLQMAASSAGPVVTQK